jgi:hypothetical protein
MTPTINHLRPASLERRSGLLSKTTPEALHLVHDLLDKRSININAHQTQFNFTFQTYRTLKLHEAFLTQVTNNRQTLAFSQFELAPFSENIPTEVAQMSRLDSNAPEFEGAPVELEYSNLALHVATSYIYRFRGIGTTLLAFNLLAAAHLKAPLMRAIDDISAINSVTQKSFLDIHGFRSGQHLNRLAIVLGEGSLGKIHGANEKIFYLNNVFDGTIDFVIPEIGIKSRV